MASYREKLNQKQMETESGKIAWCIVWIEGHWNWKKDLIFNGSIDLFDGKYARIYKLYDENNPTLTEEIECNYTYTLYKSGEAGVYKIIRDDRYSSWVKYVPSDNDWETCKNVLDAQPWRYL